MKASQVCKQHMGTGFVQTALLQQAEERKEITRDQIQARMFKLVEPAIKALEEIIAANDPRTRMTDRLRAIEILMDRTVGKKIEVGVEDTEEKDLDDEIASAFGGTLAATGTDDTTGEWDDEDDD
jgi:hypothetical protein